MSRIETEVYEGSGSVVEVMGKADRRLEIKSYKKYKKE